MEKSPEAGGGVIDVERVHTGRLPDYLRVDIRLDRQVNLGWGSITSYIELQNLLDYRNVARRIYNPSTGDVDRFTPWDDSLLEAFK
jgi:hypothetical protein